MSHLGELTTVLSGLDVIVFDFDGVLNRNYDGDGFVWSRALKDDHGVDVADFRAALFDAHFADIVIGAVDLRAKLEHLLPTLGCATAAGDFIDYWFTRDLTPCAEVLGLVAEIRATGRRCVIGTNNERHRTAFIWEHLLKDRVDGIYASGLLGVAKPDAGFFHAVQTDLGCRDTARLLLVDDMPANVAAARAAGWQAIQYGDYTQHRLGNPAELRSALGL
jgi:putative hydrolase of the HAD superfamily